MPLFARLSLVLALTLAACTDKDTGDTDLDSDTELGTEADTGTDTEPDTEPDTDPDSDTQDPGCVATVVAEVSWEDCNDAIDNDCDGLFDFDEAGCSICPSVGDALRTDDESACDDGIDNDCNGFADCLDFGCIGDPACPDETTDALCSDGIDNDGNGRIDCLSRECTESTEVTVCDSNDGAENTEALCSDGLDNDGNDRVDCDDDGCEDVGYCVSFETDEDCSDGVDNDGDALVDCADTRGCADVDYCLGEDDDATCSDGLDNDNDGAIDCADSDCLRDTAVTVCTTTNETCDNDTDDDGDGAADCLDAECADVCALDDCAPDNPFGACDGAGFVCDDTGTCVPPRPTAAGDLVITEYLISPTAAEFIEVYNATSGSLNLGGCTVGDLDTDNHTIAETVVVPTGAYAMLAKDASASIVVPDYVYAGGVALSGGDEVRISCDGVDIDIIAYGTSGNGNDPAFPAPASGTSAILSPTVLAAGSAHLSNDAGTNWCSETNTYDDGLTGTPGAANSACDAR